MSAPDGVVELLGEIELFRGLSPDGLAQVASCTTQRSIASGTVLFHQGDAADGLYLVRTGRLQVRRDEVDGETRLLGHRGRGQVVGEIALISGGTRTATLIADRDSVLLHLGQADFDRLVDAEPSVLRAIAAQIVERLSREGGRDEATVPVASITLLPLGDEPEVAGTIAALQATLLRLVPDAVVAEAGPAPEAIDALELQHPLVVMVGSPEDPEWTSQCIRRSDLIVPVAAARSRPGVRAVESEAAERRSSVGTRIELVLAHPSPKSEPSGTRRWLGPRSLDRHHHARAGVEADTDRVGRLLLGRGITLVLSGGGARGMAELGVLRAIQELGIPIDAVGGTSAGALVGATIARGWDWERATRALRSGVTDGRPPIDLTFPTVALATGRRITERLRAAGGGLDVEDLLIDFFCVSTNLTRKRVQVHDHGPAWRAVRASLAIPGVFPPLPEDGDVLVDGGVLDNYPVGLMRRRHPGATVIGVDVGARHDLDAGSLPADGVVSGWHAARAALARARGDRKGQGSVTGTSTAADLSPGIVRVLARLTELGVREPEGRDLADVTIEPPIHDLPMLDFDRFDDIVTRGYAEALATLTPWWAGRE